MMHPRKPVGSRGGRAPAPPARRLAAPPPPLSARDAQNKKRDAGGEGGGGSARAGGGAWAARARGAAVSQCPEMLGSKVGPRAQEGAPFHSVPPDYLGARAERAH